MVVSVSPQASAAAVGILERGGNAVDAAVAAAFALAVTHPAAGNIGGGGFMTIHPPAGKGEPTVIEYRETAPAAATRDMFVADDRQHGCRVVGVPGTVRGMEMAFRAYGSRSVAWADVIMPAVRLAEEGFVLDPWTAGSLDDLVAGSPEFPELRRVFGAADGWKPGDRLRQPDLARSLRTIAEFGADAFYAGPIADLLVDEMERGGGLITRADLAGYRAVERRPIHGTYRGYDIYAPPPPSGGGIVLVEMLNMLETVDLAAGERWSPDTLQFMAEVMRRAYCDRARFLGDPAFAGIPGHLTTKAHAVGLAASIERGRPTSSGSLAPEIPLPPPEGDSTTHFSVIDRDGLAVANTYTLEHSYGSRVVVRGGGFLLNNEMLDFNRRPGITDRSGGIGTEANVVAPGKRMLSSQTPVIVSRHGKPLLITGSPGGRTITNTVLCTLVNVLDYGMPLRDAIDAPRIHQQWFPEGVKVEESPLLEKAVASLRAMGYEISSHRQGDAHSILVEPGTGTYVGAADRRILGGAAGY